MKTQTYRQRQSTAFTLVELLVVMGVISVMVTASILTFSGVGQSAKLRGASSTLAGELEFGRLSALAKNRRVEVRFYPANTKTDPSATGYQSYALYSQSEDGAELRPLTRRQVLPTGITVLDVAKLSPLLQRSTTGTQTTPLGTESYVFFSYEPDGSTDLNSNDNFVTVAALRDTQSLNGSELPSNFVTLLVDPDSGRVRTIQP